MTKPITSLEKLLKNMNPVLNQGEYVFVSQESPSEEVLEAAEMIFKEKEGITLILQSAKAKQFSIDTTATFAWITLQVHSDLEAIGLTAVFSNALADQGISCNVVAGYYHDHIFASSDKAELAVEVLNKLAE